jgi:hypothetical protein
MNRHNFIYFTILKLILCTIEANHRIVDHLQTVRENIHDHHKFWTGKSNQHYGDDHFHVASTAVYTSGYLKQSVYKSTKCRGSGLPQMSWLAIGACITNLTTSSRIDFVTSFGNILTANISYYDDKECNSLITDTAHMEMYSTSCLPSSDSLLSSYVTVRYSYESAFPSSFDYGFLQKYVRPNYSNAYHF